MPSNSAEYMRKYRARKAAKEAAGEVEFGYDGPTDADRIAELEAEVQHLKAELAKRPEHPFAEDWKDPAMDAYDRFNTRPFTPVPKTRK